MLLNMMEEKCKLYPSHTVPFISNHKIGAARAVRDIHQVTCRSDNIIDLLFQVNNCKSEKSRTELEHSWSKTLDRVQMRMNRKLLILLYVSRCFWVVVVVGYFMC
jgi:hypothetical protein